MPIPKIARSQVQLEVEEAVYLQKTLLSGVYDQHIAFQISNVIQKLQMTVTLELEGMELIVLNTVLSNLIVAPTTSNDDVMRLAGTQRKFREQIIQRYREILAAQ